MGTTTIIATRKTFEGHTVHLYSDGVLTWGMGQYVKGSPVPRTEQGRTAALAAGWLVLGDIELYDDEELPALIAAARWTVRHGGTPGDMRRRFADQASSEWVVRPIWTTVAADRDGRPRVRCWVLPRLRWPGLSIWSEKGKYSVWSEIGRDGTYAPTGMEFRNLSEVYAYLRTFDRSAA